MVSNPFHRRLAGWLIEPHLLLPVIAVVLLAVIWGTTVNFIRLEHDLEVRGVASSTLELAETYEAQVVRSLREIDQTLRLVQFLHARSGTVDLAALRSRGLLLPDLVFVTSIVAEDGALVASTRAPDAPPSVAALSETSHEGVVMGRPWRGADGEWRLEFSRGLVTPAGKRAGAVSVALPAAYFVSGYEPSRLGQLGVLALVGSDGMFRARRVGDQVTSGDMTNFAALVRQDGERTTAVASSWDGVRRFTATRTLYDFPLAIAVGLAEDEQMATATQRARTYAQRALLGSVALVLLLALLGQLGRRASDFRRRAEEALNLRNRAIESSVNAIVITSLDRPGLPIDYVNPAFERITGYQATEVIGRSGTFLLGSETAQAGLRELDLALRERREGHAVLRNFRKDGSLFWNDFHIAPVRNDKGDVTHYVGVMNDVTEAKNYEGQLAHQANFDALTGLANRNLLQDRLDQAIVAARRHGVGVAAVFLDLDHFKVVNDSLGHHHGDQLLCAVATRLKECVRESDTVARLGGDEFVLVLSGRPGEGASAMEAHALAVVQKLVAEVSRPLMLEGRHISPTCSLGVSLFPQDGDDGATLLRNADAAMYRAKELGRNRAQFFTADVHQRIKRRMELESNLRQALQREEFELHYQPQVSLKRGVIVGIEALVRWRHPELGLVYPGQFIPFAEETGLIVPLGEWVLRTACRQARAWQDEGLPAVPVAVNMSARQCEQPDIDQVVRRALADARLEPRYLELEITESLSMANPEQSVPLMRKLRDIGVQLSIDDFGTGFSNLSYLRRFPVDRLKIDLSFVREITTDAGSLAISEAIITMSHRLNLQVVAEGVETEGQVALLSSRRCDSIQGYFFSPPVAADGLAALLREGRCLPEAHLHRASTLHVHNTLQ